MWHPCASQFNLMLPIIISTDCSRAQSQNITFFHTIKTLFLHSLLLGKAIDPLKWGFKLFLDCFLVISTLCSSSKADWPHRLNAKMVPSVPKFNHFNMRSIIMHNHTTEFKARFNTFIYCLVLCLCFFFFFFNYKCKCYSHLRRLSRETQRWRDVLCLLHL